ncbi:hypothetical protein [Halobacteriovorax sp. HLS]|uniref:hypothetical protein n=1 Tax=Halobacteriovorax sp. HLS TaxID=2234000 RepID=UPI000FD80BA3|nr:hypothetical protein [Halobacteriovorax sp. HLS]
MLVKFRKYSIVFISLFTLLFTPSAFAEAKSSDILDESLGDLSLVGGMGLGGAILGLSTLSFVEEPKDHLKNILIGGAFGVIVGVGVVAWQQATKSKGTYENLGSIPTAEFGTSQRVAWQSKQSEKSFRKNAKNFPTFSYAFDF